MFSAFLFKKKKTPKSIKLVPGVQFPDVFVPSVDGTEINLKSSGDTKLIVVYRGQFCRFSKSMLDHIQEKQFELLEAGIKLVVISADPVSTSKEFITQNGYTFPVACGLNIEQMRLLGLYITDPTNIIEQSYSFAEPAYFLLGADNNVILVDISSFPMGGRVNIDNVLEGFNWLKEQAIKNPERKNVTWGSKY